MKKIAVFGLGLFLGIAQTAHAMDYDFDFDSYHFQEATSIQEQIRPGLSSLLPQNTLDSIGVVLMALNGYSTAGATGVVRGACGQLLYNAGEKGYFGRYVSTPENDLSPHVINTAARYGGTLLQQGRQGLSELALTDATVHLVRRITGISSFAAQEGKQDGKVLSFARGTASLVDQVMPFMVQTLVVSPLMHGFSASDPVH